MASVPDSCGLNRAVVGRLLRYCFWTQTACRERWLPQKKRLNSIRNSHPTSVRFHRARSWLEAAEQLDPGQHVDQILILQWIAFNALYGQWDQILHKPVSDRESWRVFLSRMLELDASGHIISLLQENKRLVVTILENTYLNHCFWNDPCREKPAATAGVARPLELVSPVLGALSFALSPASPLRVPRRSERIT